MNFLKERIYHKFTKNLADNGKMWNKVEMNNAPMADVKPVYFLKYGKIGDQGNFQEVGEATGESHSISGRILKRTEKIPQSLQ